MSTYTHQVTTDDAAPSALGPYRVEQRLGGLGHLLRRLIRRLDRGVVDVVHHAALVVHGERRLVRRGREESRQRPASTPEPGAGVHMQIFARPSHGWRPCGWKLFLNLERVFFGPVLNTFLNIIFVS